MPTTKTDLRLKKTQAKLREALLTFLTEGRCIASVTAAELTERAGVNRSTFYLHYKNVAEMATEYEDALLSRLQSAMKGTRRPSSPAGQGAGEALTAALCGAFAAAKELRTPLLAFLLPTAGASLPGRLCGMLLPVCTEYAAHRKRSATPGVAEGYAAFLAGGLVGLLPGFLQQDVTPGQMTEIVREIVMEESILLKFRQFG